MRRIGFLTLAVALMVGCRGGSDGADNGVADIPPATDIPVSPDVPDAVADVPIQDDTTTDPGPSDVAPMKDAHTDPGTADDGPSDPGQPDPGQPDPGPVDNGPLDPGPQQGVSIDWVSIPGGTFQMGATDLDSIEQPVHAVTIPSFHMAKTEVTVAQYQSCVTAGTCRPATCPQGADDVPVVCLWWAQSGAYCAWAGGRLCSEAEWEYAARNGPTGNKYPWGDRDPTCEDAVWLGLGSDCSPPSPAAVCSKPSGNDTWGVCDLAGNVWEWVEDDYHSDYTSAPTDGSAWVDSPRGSARIGRGGSFFDVGGAVDLRGSYRNFCDPAKYGNYLGARCCKSP